MKVVAIIQARIGSTRLPGKVMKTIADKTILEHVIERVKNSKEIDDIIIATTTKENDNVIVKEAERLGIKWFRGSEDDVLSRYYYAAQENKADAVVRITSDCPLIDSEIMDKMIYTFKTSSLDYLSNTITRTYPRGLDCEVFRFQALETSFGNAKLMHQREHVTPYIYENTQLFKIEQFTDNEDNSDLRCTLDTEEDYQTIKKTLEGIKANYTYEDLLEFLKANPDITSINSSIIQKDVRGNDGRQS